MIKDFLAEAWAFIKTIRWGWGALFAAYGFVMYAHLVKLFGSSFLGAVAVYFILLIVARIMRGKN